MISHRKRFIFVHIPKTGGSSVAHALRRHGILLQYPQNWDSIYFKHAHASDLKRMMGDEFERYFRFTVVRNPWDWAVSSYAFNRGMHLPFLRHTDLQETGWIPEFSRDWAFKPWLRWWLDTVAPRQSTMITDAAGALLVHQVIRFEELSRLFPRLCLRLRVWPRRLPHVNQTAGRDGGYQAYYDEESRGWIAESFAEDIRRFGYGFDGIAGPPAP